MSCYADARYVTRVAALLRVMRVSHALIRCHYEDVDYAAITPCLLLMITPLRVIRFSLRFATPMLRRYAILLIARCWVVDISAKAKMARMSAGVERVLLRAS